MAKEQVGLDVATYVQMPLSFHGDVVNKSDPVIVGFIHFSKWIMGSYGCFLPISTTSDSVGSIPKIVMGDEATIAFLLDTIHAAREDLLYSCLEGDSIPATSTTITPPPFFVLNDHESQSVVLLIRGTKNLNDFVVDMSSASIPWEEGFVHEGMGRIAKHIADNPDVLTAVKEGLHKNPNYRVRTVGHSLGAGLAALVAIRWNNNKVFHDVECFAFAPPPILTLSVKNRGSGFVHSLVNEDDMIPRLNATCIRELACRVENAIDARQREDAVLEQRSVLAWAQSFQGFTRSVKRNAQDMLNGVMAMADMAVGPALGLVSSREEGSLCDQWNSLRKRSRQWIVDDINDESTKEWKKCIVDEFFLPGTIYYYHPCIGNFEMYMDYERKKSTMGVSLVNKQLGLDDVNFVVCASFYYYYVCSCYS